MITILLLTIGLDLSRPEFQPELDTSGNYIISDFDVSDNTLSISPEDFAEVSLSPSAELSKEDDKGSRTIITVNAYVKYDYRISSGAIAVHSGDSLYYYLCTAGVEYTVSSGSVAYSALSLNKGAACTAVTGTSFTFERDTYLLKENSTFSLTFNDGNGVNPEEPEDPSGNDPSGNNPSGGSPYDDTALLSKLDSMSVQLRVISFICLISFLYPLAKSICKNIVGGD